MYKGFIKRFADFLISLCAILVLWPFLLIFAIIGAVAMKGNPFFLQKRPGFNEKVFSLIKFRTMTCEKDKEGKLLPDDKRLTAYGKFLRSTSIDELPELFNILVGDMSLIRPRPQLVRDMVFMSENQRRRHSVRPGLSGLAQVNGRNAIAWESKLNYDLEYIENISFWGDVKIFFKTIKKVFAREDISEEGKATAEDFGDYLLRTGAVTREKYDELMLKAQKILENT